MRLMIFHHRLPNPCDFYGVRPAFTLTVSNYVVAHKALRVSPQFKAFYVDYIVNPHLTYLSNRYLSYK